MFVVLFAPQTFAIEKLSFKKKAPKLSSFEKKHHHGQKTGS